MRKRSGLLIMLVGVVVAFLASLMVLAMARQASAQQRAEVPQVLVVMASRDVPEGIVLAADALVVQAFPADFVPHPTRCTSPVALRWSCRPSPPTSSRRARSRLRSRRSASTPSPG